MSPSDEAEFAALREDRERLEYVTKHAKLWVEEGVWVLPVTPHSHAVLDRAAIDAARAQEDA